MASSKVQRLDTQPDTLTALRRALELAEHRLKLAEQQIAALQADLARARAEAAENLQRYIDQRNLLDAESDRAFQREIKRSEVRRTWVLGIMAAIPGAAWIWTAISNSL